VAFLSVYGMTQVEVAEKAGINRASLSQMEKIENKLRTTTLEKPVSAIKIAIN